MSRYDAPVDIGTREDALARVLAMALSVCGDASCSIQPVLDQCVAESVDRFWPGSVRNYVPVLAFREVQECIRRGTCPGLTGGSDG